MVRLRGNEIVFKLKKLYYTLFGSSKRITFIDYMSSDRIDKIMPINSDYYEDTILYPDTHLVYCYKNGCWSRECRNVEVFEHNGYYHPVDHPLIKYAQAIL